MAKKDIGLVSFLILLSLVIYLLDYSGWAKRLSGLASRPFITGEQGLTRFHQESVLRFGYLFKNKKTMDEELLRLKNQLQQMTVDQNQLVSCRVSNEKLTKMLGANLPAAWKFLPAKVVAVNQEMTINQGERAGFKEGMNVVSNQVLVGRISRVTDFAGVVQMPTTPGIKIPVAVKRTVIQAKGMLYSLGGQLYLDKITQSEDIQVGDIVVSLGDELYLDNLVIGEISEVLPKSAEIYRQARVTPLVNYSSLDMVFGVIR